MFWSEEDVKLLEGTDMVGELVFRVGVSAVLMLVSLQSEWEKPRLKRGTRPSARRFWR